jgi:transcriptional regulator with XRE-family HTH domain
LSPRKQIAAAELEGDVSFRQKLNLARASKEFTWAEVAQRTGVSAQFIWMVRMGKRRMSLNTLGRISNVLGVTPEWLLRDES